MLFETLKSKIKSNFNAFGKKNSSEYLNKVKSYVTGEKTQRISFSCFIKETCTPVKKQKVNLVKKSFLIFSLKFGTINFPDSNFSIYILNGTDYN